MANIPSKVQERLVNVIKRFQSILQSAKTRDVNESDTVIIVTDLLSEAFGFDKYSEITSEFTIRGTYCDLATKIDNKVQYLIEVKAIGLELKDHFVKQAIDYAANQGIDWVILTNGNLWKIYKVGFGKPITQETVCEFEFLSLNHKNTDDLDTLYLLTKEGWLKSHIETYHAQKQVLSKFFIATILLSDGIIGSVKRELRKLSPDIKVTDEQVFNVIQQEVLKREVIEGEKVEEAKKAISRAQAKLNRTKKSSPDKKDIPDFGGKKIEDIIEENQPEKGSEK
jgi:predicted type IV restriction endonuclease